MTEKKLSRRDAMKLLVAAVGAATVANLPPEWSKPGLETGVLPAHAQTSVLHTLACDPNQVIARNFPQNPTIQVTSGVTIAPPTDGIVMRYTIVVSSVGGVINSPVSPSGTVTTSGGGYASIIIEYQNFVYGNSFTVTWSFENTSDGTGTCQQIFEVPLRSPA